MTLQRLLVPYDGSAFSRRALSLAMPVAQQHEAGVTLVQATALPPRRGQGPPVSPPLPPADGDVRQAAEDALQRLARRLGRRYGVSVDGELRDGDVLPQIEQAVQQRAADVVVMATHGRSGMSRLWLGSTAEALLRQLHVPMLVTRKERKYTTTAPDEPLFPRVVVALDGSAHAESALESVLRLVDDSRSRIVLAQVLVAPTVPATPAWIAETSARIDEEYLQPIAARVRQRGYDVGTHVAMAGDAARGVLDIVKAERAYLLGLSTHGRTGTRRLLLGSVADKLLRASGVPMLVTPMT